MNNRYGINFYNKNLDVNAGTYFEAADFFSAREKAKDFNKEYWISGTVFFIEEKNHSAYVPIEDFISMLSFDVCFEVVRVSTGKVIFRELFEQSAKALTDSANAYSGEKYAYRKITLQDT